MSRLLYPNHENTSITGSIVALVSCGLAIEQGAERLPDTRSRVMCRRGRYDTIYSCVRPARPRTRARDDDHHDHL